MLPARLWRRAGCAGALVQLCGFSGCCHAIAGRGLTWWVRFVGRHLRVFFLLVAGTIALMGRPASVRWHPAGDCGCPCHRGRHSGRGAVRPGVDQHPPFHRRCGVGPGCVRPAGVRSGVAGGSCGPVGAGGRCVVRLSGAVQPRVTAVTPARLSNCRHRADRCTTFNCLPALA